MTMTIRRMGTAAREAASVAARPLAENGLASVWFSAVLLLGTLGLVNSAGQDLDRTGAAGGMIVAGVDDGDTGETGDGDDEDDGTGQSQNEPWDDMIEYLLWLMGQLV